MKYLIGIPCLYGAGHTIEAIRSVIHANDTDLILIDNGAERDVSEVLVKFAAQNKNVGIIRNQENIYVNPAWNQIIKYFLGSNSDYLMIMNSDLVLHKNWKNVLDNHFENYSEIIPVPVISNNRNILDSCHMEGNKTEVFEGTPGVLIILNKVQANLIYPIPNSIKVWFGDNWIYEGLRKLGYKTVVLNSLLTYHSGSQNVSKVEGIGNIIEQDKIEWEKLK